MSYDLKLDQGDLRIANSGDLAVVVDTDKLIQDLLKIIITPLRGNKSHLWYGSSVNGAIIGESFDLDFVSDSATAQVRNAVENLFRMQLSQSQIQILSPAEAISAVKDIYVNNNPIDRRVVEIKVSVITGALTVESVRFTVRL